MNPKPLNPYPKPLNPNSFPRAESPGQPGESRRVGVQRSFRDGRKTGASAWVGFGDFFVDFGVLNRTTTITIITIARMRMGRGSIRAIMLTITVVLRIRIVILLIIMTMATV